jgi:hypothetical protein
MSSEYKPGGPSSDALERTNPHEKKAVVVEDLTSRKDEILLAMHADVDLGATTEAGRRQERIVESLTTRLMRNADYLFLVKTPKKALIKGILIMGYEIGALQQGAVLIEEAHNSFSQLGVYEDAPSSLTEGEPGYLLYLYDKPW